MVLFSTQVKVAFQAEVWRLIFVQYVARSLCCVVMRMRTMGLRKLINLHVAICILTDFIIKSYDAVWCNTPISSKLQHTPPPPAQPLGYWTVCFHPLGQKLTSNAPPCSFLKGKISDRDFLFARETHTFKYITLTFRRNDSPHPVQTLHSSK